MRNSVFLDVAIFGTLIPTHLHTSPYVTPFLTSQFLKPLILFFTVSHQKMMHNLFFPKHFLDHFYFLGLFAICLSLDYTSSHMSFSKGDSLTLTLLRPLDLAGVQTFLCSLLMMPDNFPLSFWKTLDFKSYTTKQY